MQLPGGDTIRTFKGHNTSTHSAVGFFRDGRFVLSGGTEAATRLWNRQTGQPIREFIGSPAGTAAAAFSPDGSKILTTVGLPNPGVRLWNTETGGFEKEFGWTGSWPTSAVLSKDGTKIVAGAQDNYVRIFDVATGSLIRTLTNAGWSTRIALSPTAPFLAWGSSDSSAKLYNFDTGEVIHNFFSNAGSVTSLNFSPKGETLLIAWQDGLIRLYDTLTFDLRFEFVTPAAFLETAVFSPDGQYILTGETFPNIATIWDALNGKPIRTVPFHAGSVSAVAFHPDGRSILTGAELIREWSITDLAARLQIKEIGNEVQVSWSQGMLERAEQPQGPWEVLTDATSPFSMRSTMPAVFFRVRAD